MLSLSITFVNKQKHFSKSQKILNRYENNKHCHFFIQHLAAPKKAPKLKFSKSTDLHFLKQT